MQHRELERGGYIARVLQRQRRRRLMGGKEGRGCFYRGRRDLGVHAKEAWGGVRRSDSGSSSSLVQGGGRARWGTSLTGGSLLAAARVGREEESEERARLGRERGFISDFWDAPRGKKQGKREKEKGKFGLLRRRRKREGEEEEEREILGRAKRKRGKEK